MKKNILPILLGCSLIANAQERSIFSFSSLDAPFQWKNIQSFSSTRVAEMKTIYDYRQAVKLFDASTRKSVQDQYSGALVAATGYASTTKQLFYIPMHAPELRWAQWSQNETPTIFSLRSSVLSQLDYTKTEEQITRMTIGKNGFGYALTNDAMHLIEFTVGDKPRVRDLGQLIDAASNAQQSIHSACSSFGGDMVAGDDGNLYLISQRNQIYVFNPERRIATHIGSIKGLTEQFTSNGAAASEDGKLIVSCSYGDQQLFVVDPASWEAKPLGSVDQKGYNMSDLASGNLLARKPKTSSDLISADNPGIMLYPNPLTNGSRLQIAMEKAVSGTHVVQLMDLSGQLISQQLINLNEGAQTFNLDLPGQVAKGTYIVKMIDPASKTIQTSKLMVQY